jgi:hypothetical protein
MPLAIPATAVEIAFQAAVIGVAGAPFVDSVSGVGIDLLNSGLTGEIGSQGMVAQSATNPNAF